MGNRPRFSLDEKDFSELDAGLSKSFVEIANTLIEKGGRSDDLMERFEALAPQLPPEARRALSEYLLSLPAPPRALVLHMAMDVAPVAEPLLREFDFIKSDLESLLEKAPHAHRMILARRGDLPLSVAARLERGDAGQAAAGRGRPESATERDGNIPEESIEDINEALFGAFERMTKEMGATPGKSTGPDPADLELVWRAIADLHEARKPLQAGQHYDALERMARAEMRLYGFLKRLAHSLQTFSGSE